jgi:membrane-bound acyltransferase YfiQ involved in biofilm formation
MLEHEDKMTQDISPTTAITDVICFLIIESPLVINYQTGTNGFYLSLLGMKCQIIWLFAGLGSTRVYADNVEMFQICSGTNACKR